MAKTKASITKDGICISINGRPTTLFRVTHKRRVCVFEKTILPSKSESDPKATVVIGGSPITKQIAIELNTVVFGMTSAFYKSAWIKSGLVFRDAESSLSFGLLAQTPEIKAFIMCLQAFVLKHLLFRHVKKSAELLTTRRVLRPDSSEQENALVSAMLDILHKAACATGNRRVSLCLPQNKAYFGEDADVCTDGITEKLHLFEFSDLEAAESFLRTYLHIFLESSGPGCLIFLYSVVLSKGLARILDEFGGDQDHLLNGYAGCTQALINLMLTGNATPYTHNGTIYEGDDLDSNERKRKTGILDRSEIGLLVWNEHDPCGSQLGSRLKTPRLPIWVTNSGGQFGCLFNPNRELTRDYHAEHHFELQYYSSGRGQRDVAVLSIDTKSLRTNKEERDFPLLERLILTKWHEAKICWNGTTPFV